ncbi:transcription termination/antitermination NusG family protein [Enterobacter hormaechei]|uniref:transcription termination/antitermination NusG family protein n=1 Tax=Enterobacter hormaechei TaxID=158836 RepID=UPI001F17EEEA|nr:transcription termination/antitermination NusG family protein [Enterobacter hormaechei]
MQDTFTDAWYLLRCRQNYWKTIQQNLNEVGLKTCCPLILERRRRSDKKNAYRLINSPAFPGYIFVRFNPANIHTTAIKRIPGAMDFVRFGNEIATISQAEIEALKLVHFERPQEKINLPSELKKKIEEITSAEEPAVRIDILFSMLELPTRISRSKNA